MRLSSLFCPASHVYVLCQHLPLLGLTQHNLYPHAALNGAIMLKMMRMLIHTYVVGACKICHFILCMCGASGVYIPFAYFLNVCPHVLILPYLAYLALLLQ